MYALPNIKKLCKILLTMLFVVAGVANSAIAQQATPPNPEMSSNGLIMQLLITLALLSVLLIMLLAALMMLLSFHLKTQFGFSFNLIPKINMAALWKARPAHKGAVVDSPLDHNYDGIIELDNAAPPLFNYILYGTIVFAVIYLLNYHVFQAAPLQNDEFNQEMQVAAEQKAAAAKLVANNVDENTVTQLIAGAELAAGKSIYMANCVACHGALGEGGVGPNMTDEYWIHGGGIKDIFRTIKVGVPTKGMVPWESQLSPIKMQQVASYILSLKGTNPPKAKAPQGTLYTPPAPKADSTVTKALPAPNKEKAKAS